MRAYVMERYGDAAGTRLRDVPAPAAPGAGEVQVAIRAAGLNPVDYKFREGKLRAILRPPLPVILGNEIAGEVIAVGPAVTGFAPGDRVFARLGKENGGALAEAANVPAAYLAHVPEGLEMTTAAGVPLAGLTALQALREVLGVRPGMRVLISGGAGGVGTLAIQIAKILGAHVTTRPPRRAGRCWCAIWARMQ